MFGIRRGHYRSLGYTEQTNRKYRDLRGAEVRIGRGHFIRVSVNGIHRHSTGFHFVSYPYVWHLSFDWRGTRGVSLSYCSRSY